MKKIILIILILTSYILPQELNCNVTVNYQNVPVKNRELLADFANVITDYINTTRFTDLSWEGDKINCTFSIFFSSAGSDVDYSAQLIVISQRPIYHSTRNSPILTINDGQWSFRYEVGRAMYANLDAFDGLTSFLDFYALITIGFDLDTWEEFGGTPYFKKAFDIVNLASTSSFSNGWLPRSNTYNRWTFVSNLLNEKYADFRSAIFSYHYGIDIYAQNKQEGQQRIIDLINVLYDMYEREGIIKSVFVKTFFDAKYTEIVDLLMDYQDQTMVIKLKKIDPSHAGRYDNILRER